MTIIVVIYVVGVWLIVVAGYVLNAYPDCMLPNGYGEDE